MQSLAQRRGGNEPKEDLRRSAGSKRLTYGMLMNSLSRRGAMP